MTPGLVREVFEYRSGRLLWRKKIGKKVIVGTEAGATTFTRTTMR